MRDRLKAQISAVEDIQEEFGHDIREMKEQLARLISLFEDYIKTQAVLPRGPSPCQLNMPLVQVLDHSSRPRTICHMKLVAPAFGNQCPQSCLLSWQHLDPSISQAAQEENLIDKRLTRTSPDGIPSPLLILSCSQSW